MKSKPRARRCRAEGVRLSLAAPPPRRCAMLLGLRVALNPDDGNSMAKNTREVEKLENAVNLKRIEESCMLSDPRHSAQGRGTSCSGRDRGRAWC